jgi:transposase
MLPRDRAELIVAEHAGGKSIREIAEAHGHSITTIRDYVRGRRTQPAAVPAA